MRGSSDDGNANGLETIFITRLTTHVDVPCLVTVPDLNVTLVSVRITSLTMYRRLKLSSNAVQMYSGLQKCTHRPLVSCRVLPYRLDFEMFFWKV